METNTEISALFSLIDDPDEEVFCAVSKKIVDYGKPIIPSLEHLWETNPSEIIQHRVEQLIHRLHFTDLAIEFRQWNHSAHHDLLLGALLVSKFQDPELNNTSVLQEIEKIKRNIWLELNQYLTPLEQINIVTSILYSFYGLQGAETNHKEPDQFLLHKTLSTKKGNQVSNGILYLILCELLDIPVRAVAIPKQFILAHFNTEYDGGASDPAIMFDFFIDPTSGQLFTVEDVENYFKRISLTPSPEHFSVLSNRSVIRKLLDEYSKCFDTPGQKSRKIELLQLAALLEKI